MTIYAMLAYAMGLYILIAAILAGVGTKRRLGGVKTFFISLFLTPIGGVIALSFSLPRGIMTFHRYKCNRCNFEFTDLHDCCPNCQQEGYKIMLHDVVFRGI